MTGQDMQHFHERADEIIHLANGQLEDVGPGKVSASLLYAAARFNAYVAAINAGSRPEMARTRQETIDHFVGQYRAMLEENHDDYAAHYDDRFPVNDWFKP
jgi:hypothetical protein